MYCNITDQCYRPVVLEQPPQRIISLVPSQTELLVDLGLEEKLVGVTRYCVHPKGITDRIPVMGGTKKILENRLKEAQPDLIICNKEENTAQIALMCEQLAPTYISDIYNLDDAVEMIHDIGKLTGTSFKAKSIARNIQMGFNYLPKIKEPKKLLYLIWKDPYMSVGKDTFIHDVITRAGFKNVMTHQSRYPELSAQDILMLQPDVVLFSSEPYAFTDQHMKELEQAFAKAGLQPPQSILVDGEMFSWYGSRLLKSPDYLKGL